MLQDILSGVVCGLVFSTVVLADGVFLLKIRQDVHSYLSKVLQPPLTPMIVMLAVVFGVPPAFGLLGAISGLIYNVIDDASPDGGLGSPNFVFTLAVLCIAAVISLIFLASRKKLIIIPGLLTSIAFAGVFGWILPFLADWR